MSLPVVDDLSSLSHEDIRTFYFFCGDTTHIEFMEALIQGKRDRALQIYNQCLQRLQEFQKKMQSHTL